MLVLNWFSSALCRLGMQALSMWILWSLWVLTTPDPNRIVSGSGSGAAKFGFDGSYGGPKRSGSRGFHEGIFDYGFGGFSTVKRIPEMTSRGMNGDAFTGSCPVPVSVPVPVSETCLEHLLCPVQSSLDCPFVHPKKNLLTSIFCTKEKNGWPKKHFCCIEANFWSSKKFYFFLNRLVCLKKNFFATFPFFKIYDETLIQKNHIPGKRLSSFTDGDSSRANLL